MGLLTPRQAEKVDILKQALQVLAYMRSLAMRLTADNPDITHGLSRIDVSLPDTGRWAKLAA